MKIANLRFYATGQDGGGTPTPQGGDGKSQGDDPNNKEKPDTPQGGEEGKEEPEVQDRFARENQRRRLENERLTQQLSDMQEELETLKAAKMTDAEKLSEQQKRLEKRAADAERRAKESERLLLSSQAVLKYQLPEVLSELLRGDTQEDVEEHAKVVASSLEKHYRSKFTQVIPPNPEGGDKSGLSAQANGKLSKEEQEKNQREYAQAF